MPQLGVLPRVEDSACLGLCGAPRARCWSAPACCALPSFESSTAPSRTRPTPACRRKPGQVAAGWRAHVWPGAGPASARDVPVCCLARVRLGAGPAWAGPGAGPRGPGIGRLCSSVLPGQVLRRRGDRGAGQQGAAGGHELGLAPPSWRRRQHGRGHAVAGESSWITRRLAPRAPTTTCIGPWAAPRGRWGRTYCAHAPAGGRGPVPPRAAGRQAHGGRAGGGPRRWRGCQQRACVCQRAPPAVLRPRRQPCAGADRGAAARTAGHGLPDGHLRQTQIGAAVRVKLPFRSLM